MPVRLELVGIKLLEFLHPNLPFKLFELPLCTVFKDLQFGFRRGRHVLRRRRAQLTIWHAVFFQGSDFGQRLKWKLVSTLEKCLLDRHGVKGFQVFNAVRALVFVQWEVNFLCGNELNFNRRQVGQEFPAKAALTGYDKLTDWKFERIRRANLDPRWV